MRRNISRYLFSVCMIFILAVSAVSVVPVQAAATYTLTFRSGNVGSFDTAKVNAAVKNSSLVEVKKEYIRVKAKRGTSVASAVYDAFERHKCCFRGIRCIWQSGSGKWRHECDVPQLFV